MNYEISKPNTAQSSEKLAISARRRNDPTLQELHDVKAELNPKAGCSVERIFDRASRGSLTNAVK